MKCSWRSWFGLARYNVTYHCPVCNEQCHNIEDIQAHDCGDPLKIVQYSGEDERKVLSKALHTNLKKASLEALPPDAEPQPACLAPGSTNPKDALGIKKPNLFLIPPSSLVYQALAMQDGAVKYGPYNWRENSVSASIYIAAAMRHMASWVDGETNAADSGKPHLGHALACLGIIVDALETGNLVDDRPKVGAASKVISAWTVK
jgi:hypothetical protein